MAPKSPLAPLDAIETTSSSSSGTHGGKNGRRGPPESGAGREPEAGAADADARPAPEDAEGPPAGSPLGKRRRRARHDDQFCYVRLDGPAGPRSPPASNGGGTRKGNNGSGEEACAGDGGDPRERPRPGKRRKKKRSAEEEFETVWICSECKEAECLLTPEADTLLICDGPCRRLFHYPCVGLSRLPGEAEPFHCPDCVQGRHRCAACQGYGADGDDVFRCSKPGCGLFFHLACLAMANVEVQHLAEANGSMSGRSAGDDYEEDGNGAANPNGGASAANGNSSTGGGSGENRVQFVCPAHECWTCTQVDCKQQEQDEIMQSLSSHQQQRIKAPGSRRSKGKAKASSVFDSKSERYLIRCIECPISYHVTCIPPMARFHELALLCHRDASRFKLPDLDPEGSIQNRLEERASAKFGRYKTKQRQRTSAAAKGENRFFPGLRGDRLTARERKLVEALEKQQRISTETTQTGAIDMTPESIESGILAVTEGFCLPCDVQSEVYSVPPQYRHVTANQYDPSNRPAKIPMSSGACQCAGFCGDDCLNRLLYIECFGSGERGSGNCRVGPKCGNRVVTQRKSAKCKPQREQGKGWGLVAVQKVLRGDFVQEYVGEIVHEKEKELRLSDWASVRPNDHNYYIMSLCPDWYIDARLQGNLSRFINHSCDPNCVLLQINVGGNIRCGIFAKRDIYPGEFLSYDYNFDTRSDRFVCRCGALNCRGNMRSALGKDAAPATEKSKAEAWEAARAKYERDKKFLADHFDAETKRCAQVSHLVPDAEGPQELVSNGAQARFRGEALRGRVFLWRNAVRGSDFASRLARLGARSKRAPPLGPCS